MARETTPFILRRQIRFGETDAAGIVYTGEIPKYALEAVESWFIERLGLSWYAMNVDDGAGTPFVHLSFDFRHPLTPRHALETTVLLVEAGRSSLTLRVEGRSGGRFCFEGRLVCVFVDGVGRPRLLPESCAAVLAVERAIAMARSGPENE